MPTVQEALLKNVGQALTDPSDDIDERLGRLSRDHRQRAELQEDRLSLLEDSLARLSADLDRAREREHLPPVEGGDQVYVQQQMTLLGMRAQGLSQPAADPPSGLDDELDEKQLVLFDATARKYLDRRNANCTRSAS